MVCGSIKYNVRRHNEKVCSKKTNLRLSSKDSAIRLYGTGWNDWIHLHQNRTSGGLLCTR